MQRRMYLWTAGSGLPARSACANVRGPLLALALAAAILLVSGCEPGGVDGEGGDDGLGGPGGAAAPGVRDTAAPDTAVPGVSFRMAGPNDAVVLVPVHANGAGPLDFVLDTGATFTCVDDDLVDRLELEQRPGLTMRGRGLGGEAEVGLARIDSLRVGGILRRDLPVCVLDLDGLRIPDTQVQGLLGLNFLRSFRVTVDFRAQRMLLEPQ